MLDIESKIIAYHEKANDYRLCLTREEIEEIKKALNNQEQIRADAIDEYKLKLLNCKSDLVNDIHKAKIWVEFKRQAIEISEQLKENK